MHIYEKVKSCSKQHCKALDEIKSLINILADLVIDKLLHLGIWGQIKAARFTETPG